MENLTDFYPAFKQVGLKKAGGKAAPLSAKITTMSVKTALCKRHWTSCIGWKGKRNDIKRRTSFAHKK